MPNPKYYAVRVGLKTGIFRSWAECEPLVHGVKNAQYQSFPSPEEAQAYLDAAPCAISERNSGKSVPRKKTTKNISEDLSEPYPVPPDTLVAFVDGSYNAASKKYGYGCVLLFPDGSVKTEQGAGESPEALTARNVAGELQATVTALTRAFELGYRRVRICHDYSGIAFWYRGEWKAKSAVARDYVAFAETMRNRLEVTFEKIAAHTGIQYNELADRLAKQAVGIGDEL